MRKYLTKQLIGGIVSLLVFLTFIFFLAQILMPYNFSINYILGVTPQELAQIQQELGLDLPIWKQYFNWISRIVQGNLGTSFFGGSVSGMLLKMVPPTLLVFGLGSIAAFFLGKWLGKVAAWNRVSWLSKVATFSAVTLYSIFPPWFAILVSGYLSIPLYFLAGSIDFTPSSLMIDGYLNTDIWGSPRTPESFASYTAPAEIMSYMLITGIAIAIGLMVIKWGMKIILRKKIPVIINISILTICWITSWFVFGFAQKAFDIMFIAIKPLIVFTLLSFGDTMMIMKTSMQDTLNEDYLLTARAKGLSDKILRDKHASRNAILPAISRFIINMPYLFTGVVIIERATNWSGLGGTIFGALYSMDIPVLMGGFVVVGLISLVAQLALEVLQAHLDRRILDEIYLQ
jgi:peptide/nickel transport system permease protein